MKPEELKALETKVNIFKNNLHTLINEQLPKVFNITTGDGSSLCGWSMLCHKHKPGIAKSINDLHMVSMELVDVAEDLRDFDEESDIDHCLSVIEDSASDFENHIKAITVAISEYKGGLTAAEYANYTGGPQMITKLIAEVRTSAQACQELIEQYRSDNGDYIQLDNPEV